MEIYENLYFKPELQGIIKKHFDRLILHEKLRKAQKHLETHFVRTQLHANKMPLIDIFYYTWRIGNPGSNKALNYYENNGHVMIVYFDTEKPCYNQWGETYFKVHDLTLDQYPKAGVGSDIINFDCGIFF